MSQPEPEPKMPWLMTLPPAHRGIAIGAGIATVMFRPYAVQKLFNYSVPRIAQAIRPHQPFDFKSINYRTAFAGTTMMDLILL